MRPDEAQEFNSRVSVSGLCFPTLSAVEAIAAVGAIGVSRLQPLPTSFVNLALKRYWTPAVRGGEVMTTTGLMRFDPSADIEQLRQRARDDIDQAAAVGARSVYTSPVGVSALTGMSNADAYAEFIGNLVDYAASKNLVLAIEPTNWLYADLNFVHTFHDLSCWRRGRV